MIIKKVLETYIDITDPADIFSPNRNEMILRKLSDKFVGICYKSCYILKINNVIRKSFIYMKDTLEGDSYTNIMFEVDAIIYQPNEIIQGCNIIKKEPNGIIHGKSQYAGIQLSIQPNMSIFKEGDTVPVIVKRVRYNVNQSAISVLAIPFVPLQYEPIYYNVTGKLSKIQSTEIKAMLEQAKIEEGKLKNLGAAEKKILSFFIDILNPNKPDQSKVTKIEIYNIMDVKDGMIFKPDVSYNSTLISIGTAEDDMIKDLTSGKHNVNTVVNESMYNIYYILITQYINNLQTLQNFLTQYPTLDHINKSKEIWKMYTMLKK